MKHHVKRIKQAFVFIGLLIVFIFGESRLGFGEWISNFYPCTTTDMDKYVCFVWYDVTAMLIAIFLIITTIIFIIVQFYLNKLSSEKAS